MPVIRRFFSVVFLVLLFPAISYGATTGLSGFDLRLFRPPADGSGVLNLHGSRPLGKWKFAVGSVSDTSQGMLTVDNLSGNPVQVIDQYFTNVIVSSIGLTNFLHVGMSLPTIYFEQGEHIATREDFTTASIGDIGLEMKLTVLKDSPDSKISKFLPGLALVSITTFPSGSTEKFAGSSNVTQEAKLVIDKKIGPVYLAANGGYRALERTRVADLDVDDLVTFGAGFAWSLPFGSLDFLAEADGAFVMGNAQERTSPFEWLVGLRQRIVEGSSIEFAGGTGIGSGVGGGDYRIIIGFNFRTVPPKGGPEETLLTETVWIQKNRQNIELKSKPVLDHVVELMKSEERAEVELSGERDLTLIVVYALQDRGVSRGRMTEIPPESEGTKSRSVGIRVFR